MTLLDNGGDILTSALTAGGMSLVSQTVKPWEIDWKDAAIAAAMAGGTTALQGFLSDNSKADAEGEVHEEITVTAQSKAASKWVTISGSMADSTVAQRHRQRAGRYLQS